jgi:predicted dehydrogenase
MSETYKWGIAGTGRIARDFALGLTQVDGARLAAVASRDLERADAFAHEHSVIRAHGSYEALAADPDVDIVYVATPHSRHEADTLLFVGAGKHVLCEKPFALNARQGARMVEAARTQHVFLMEALWSRFLPAYGHIRDLLADDRIGKPRLVDGEFGFRIAHVDPKHRLFDPELGGGALLDLGVYPLHLATMVLGPPAAVSAAATLTQTHVDETVVATLSYDDGVLTASLGLNLRGGARIIGTEGLITVAPPMHRPERLTVTSPSGIEHVDCAIDGIGLAAQAREIQRCVESGLLESPTLPLDETLAVLSILDTIRAGIGVRYPGDD